MLALARAAAAAAFVLAMLAAGHLVMVLVNEVDARASADAYRHDGPVARLVSDRSLVHELERAVSHASSALNRSTLAAVLDDARRGSPPAIHVLPASNFLYVVSCAMTGAGFLMLIGSRRLRSDSWQSVTGVFAGNLIWTGGVEYGLLLASRNLGIAKGVGVVDGRVVGLFGEYVLLKHTWGVLALVAAYLLFLESSRCPVFLWARRRAPLMRGPIAAGRIDNYAPRTAFQYATTVWTFYVLLLWAYDPAVFGVDGRLTTSIFAVSLASSGYLVWRLTCQPSMGAAVRYAIGAMVVQWNCVEIAGKWGWFREPWLILTPVNVCVFFGAVVVGCFLVLRDWHTVSVRLRAHPD